MDLLLYLGLLGLGEGGGSVDVYDRGGGGGGGGPESPSEY